MSDVAFLQDQMTPERVDGSYTSLEMIGVKGIGPQLQGSCGPQGFRCFKGHLTYCLLAGNHGMRTPYIPFKGLHRVPQSPITHKQ